MPPTTTTMKAFSTQSSPMVALTPTSGPNNTPLAAAIPAPIANATVCTNGTGMPIACAMTRSCMVARIQMPNLPCLRNSQKPPMMAKISVSPDAISARIMPVTMPFSVWMTNNSIGKSAKNERIAAILHSEILLDDVVVDLEVGRFGVMAYRALLHDVDALARFERQRHVLLDQ